MRVRILLVVGLALVASVACKKPTQVPPSPPAPVVQGEEGNAAAESVPEGACDIDQVITPWNGDPHGLGLHIVHSYKLAVIDVWWNVSQSNVWYNLGSVNDYGLLTSWNPSPNPPNGHAVYANLKIKKKGTTEVLCTDLGTWVGWGI